MAQVHVTVSMALSSLFKIQSPASQADHTVGSDLELRILLPPFPKCWNYEHVPLSPVYAETEIKPQVLYAPGEHFANRAAPLAARPPLLLNQTKFKWNSPL